MGGNFSKHVMELLSSRQDSMSVTEIARKLRVNRSYASGYLDAMVDAGMLEKPENLERFCIGRRQEI